MSHTPHPRLNHFLQQLNTPSFPYHQTDPALYARHFSTYYHLRLPSHSSTLGFVLPSVAEVLRNLPAWALDDASHPRTLTLLHGANEEERSKIVADTTAAMRATGHFEILQGWRDELFPVYDYDGRGGTEVVFSVERAASALFGVVTYGCHMTCYVRSRRKWSGGDVDGWGEPEEREAEEEEEEVMKVWVPRRARSKQTYGGMLDNTVAGGVATGETPLESLVREAHEEASLPEEMVREKARAVGTVTYFHIRDERAGGETGLLQPECQYVYDMELPEDVLPDPSDDEVEEFRLMSVQEVREGLAKGEFKPNCALVLLDFFVRHGILTAENEEDYVEIVARLHRRLEFPTV